MTIKSSLEELYPDAEGDTIAKVLRSATGAGGYTIGEALSEVAADGIESYVISFNANGGSGTVSPVACVKGATITLPDDTGLTAPSSKEFAGWAEASDATEGVTSYSATEDTTLYAVWVAEE